jgi:hypothetical protein
MSKEILGSLFLSGLLTFGIVKWQQNVGTSITERQKNEQIYIPNDKEPEDELYDEFENLSYTEFLKKLNLPDTTDSLNKYKFIKNPNTDTDSISLESTLGLDTKKIKRLRDEEKYDELSEYLDEKIGFAIDNPRNNDILKKITTVQLRKIKNELMYPDDN